MLGLFGVENLLDGDEFNKIIGMRSACSFVSKAVMKCAPFTSSVNTVAVFDYVHIWNLSLQNPCE